MKLVSWRLPYLFVVLLPSLAVKPLSPKAFMRIFQKLCGIKTVKQKTYWARKTCKHMPQTVDFLTTIYQIYIYEIFSETHVIVWTVLHVDCSIILNNKSTKIFITYRYTVVILYWLSRQQCRRVVCECCRILNTVKRLKFLYGSVGYTAVVGFNIIFLFCIYIKY